MIGPKPLASIFAVVLLGSVLGFTQAVDPKSAQNAVAGKQAAKSELDALMTASAEGEIDQVRKLLKTVKIDSSTADGWTALHFASRAGQTAVVDLLLKQGANPNLAEKETGTTPLHLACLNGNRRVIRLLLTHGADKSIKSKHGNTAEQFLEQGFESNRERLKSGRSTPNR